MMRREFTLTLTMDGDEFITPIVVQALREHANIIEQQFQDGEGPDRDGRHVVTAREKPVTITWTAEIVDAQAA